MQLLFTFLTQNRKICVKFIPHRPILPRRPLKALDAASDVNRIKRCEVAQLHGQAAGTPPHFGRNLLDQGVGCVEAPERQFAIQVKRDKQMLARPFDRQRFSHAARMSDPAGEEKAETRMKTKIQERETYLQGKADGQDNLLERILANWNQLRPLDPLELRRQLLELKDEICDA